MNTELSDLIANNPEGKDIIIDPSDKAAFKSENAFASDFDRIVSEGLIEQAPNPPRL